MVATPDSISLYQRIMTDAWDERDYVGVPTLFQGFFARNGQTIYTDDAEVLDIDIIRADGEKTSALIPRGGIHRSMGSLQIANHEQLFTDVNRVYPLSVEIYQMYAGQFNKRIMGEMVYRPFTKAQRLRRLAVVGMRETVKRTVRMFERLAAQSIRTGKQDAILGEASPSFDWRRAAANTITVGTKWDTASPTIFADIDGAGDKIRQNGHMRMDGMIAGSSAWAAALNNSDFQTFADNRRYGFIQVGDMPVPSKYQWILDGGADPQGTILTPKGRRLWVFTYDEGYTTSGGTYTPYMPVDECLLFSSEARCDRYFGPSETLPMDSRMMAFYRDHFGMAPNAMPSNTNIKGGVINSQMFHFDAYGNNDNTTITHRTQSAPIFAPVHTDCFALLDGCV